MKTVLNFYKSKIDKDRINVNCCVLSWSCQKELFCLLEGFFFCRTLANYHTLLASKLTALVTGLDTDVI